MDAQGAILQLLEESQIGEVCMVAAAAADAGRRLGDVLAAAAAAQRERAGPALFTDDLPPVEHIEEREEEARPQEGAGAGEAAAAAAAAAAGGAEAEDFGLELNLIDMLAGGQEVPQRSEPPDLEAPPAAAPEQPSSAPSASAPRSAPAAPAAAPSEAERARPPQHPLEERSAEGETEEAATLPDVEQFVLSQRQLKEMAAKAGVDFEALLAGLKDKGIQLDA